LSEDFAGPTAGFDALPGAGYVAGSRIAGYLLEEQIGRGGMAVVFRARDERLSRQVALKILSPALASDDGFRQRFIGESRKAAAVDDPHIIPVHEAGEAAGVLFIVMRYVPGGDVRSLVRSQGPLPAARAAAIISPVASALDAAHAAGLVHRDVKPANMLLDVRQGRPDHVYLSDFGLSKDSLSSAGLTRSGQFLGTLDYSSPQQIEGRQVDGRADQYSLACAAFELLTGAPPFLYEHIPALMWAHMSELPPMLTFRRPDLPASADAVMARALAKAPADRYLSCRDFADALRQAFGLVPYHSDPGTVPPVSHPPTAVADLGNAGPISPPPAASDLLTRAVNEATNPRQRRPGGAQGAGQEPGWAGAQGGPRTPPPGTPPWPGQPPAGPPAAGPPPGTPPWPGPPPWQGTRPAPGRSPVGTTPPVPGTPPADTRPPMPGRAQPRPIGREVAAAGLALQLAAGAAGVAGNSFPSPLSKASYLVITFYLAVIALTAVGLVGRRRLVLAVVTGLWAPAAAFLAADVIGVLADHSLDNSGSYLVAYYIADLSDVLGVVGLILVGVALLPAAARRRVPKLSGLPAILLGSVALSGMAQIALFASFPNFTGAYVTEGLVALAIGLLLAWYALSLEARSLAGALLLGWSATTCIVFLVNLTVWSSLSGAERSWVVLGLLIMAVVIVLTINYLRLPAARAPGHQQQGVTRSYQ